MAPFLDELWESVTKMHREHHRHLLWQRLLLLVMMFAVGMNVYGAIQSLLR